MILRYKLTVSATFAVGLLAAWGGTLDEVPPRAVHTVPVVPADMLSHLPENTQAYCAWDRPSDAGDGRIDPDELAQATENSEAWIRAVLAEEYVPEDLKEHIVGVVEAIDGYDVTRAAFGESGFEFLVTQSSSRIVVVARPAGAEESADAESNPDAAVYLSKMLEKLFQHAKAIQYLRRREVTPFGAQLTVDHNIYGEDGTPLSIEERESISALSIREASEERQRLTRLREDNLRGIDPTLPRNLIGGAMNYWWGQVYAGTDGSIVLFTAGKGYGGKYETVHLKDWFRKDKLPSSQRHNKRRRSGAPWPPKDAPSRADE